MESREDGEIVGKCRPEIGLQLLGAVAALSLFACAQLAGLDDRDDADIVSEPKAVQPSERANEPDAEKKVDQNAEDLSVSQADVEFGSVVCQTESKRTELVINNRSDKGRKFTVTIPEDAPFGIDGAVGNVLTGDLWAKGTAKVSLYAKPNTSGLTKATAVVASNGAFINVPLGVNGTGAELEWGTELAEVGETPLNTDGTLKVVLKNKGTSPAFVKKFDFQTAGSPFSVSPSTLTIQPKTETELTVKLAKGSSVSGLLTNKVTPDAFGQCSAPPGVQVTGQRVDTSVTVSGADFGRQPCNTTPSGQKGIVIKNYYNKPVKWTLKTTPTKYTLASGAATTGSVEPATGSTPSTATIRFNAPPLGTTLGTLEEEVTVTIENTPGSQLPANALGDKKVKLRTDVRGVLISVNATAFTFTAKIDASAKNDFKVINQGNETAKINWDFTRTAGDPAWSNLPGTTTTYGPGTTTTKITYSPTGAPPNTAKLVPVQNGGYKICNPQNLPAEIKLTGTDGQVEPPPPPPPPPPSDGGIVPPN